jgi:hypothetical protein
MPNGDAQLAAVDAQQKSLAAAVAAGELWMEAGVAERAAARCEQAVEEIDESLWGAEKLTRLRKFGDNEDGHAAAARFAQAGAEYIDTMRKAQQVFRTWRRPTGRPDARSPRPKRRTSRCSVAGRSEAPTGGCAGPAYSRMRCSNGGAGPVAGGG